MPATASPDLDKRTPTRAVFDTPVELLDQAMGLAYWSYRAGRYALAAKLCKGILGSDHRYWWAYALYGAVLRKQGRLREATVQIDCALKYEPGQPKLTEMKNAVATRIRATVNRPGGAAGYTSRLRTFNAF